jgi:hypothetical protein
MLVDVFRMLPTFGESINSLTQLQKHEALKGIEVHNLLKTTIVLAHDLL